MKPQQSRCTDSKYTCTFKVTGTYFVQVSEAHSSDCFGLPLRKRRWEEHRIGGLLVQRFLENSERQRAQHCVRLERFALDTRFRVVRRNSDTCKCTPNSLVSRGYFCGDYVFVNKNVQVHAHVHVHSHDKKLKDNWWIEPPTVRRMPDFRNSCLKFNVQAFGKSVRDTRESVLNWKKPVTFRFLICSR